MKILSAVFAVVTVLSAADPRVAEPGPEGTPSGSGRLAAPQRLAVPHGAVEFAPGTFHYTDAQGKKWIYRQTPFGVARLEDAPDRKPVPAGDLYPGAKATADGDTIHFERPGPFGVYRWEKNKSELDEMERAVWNLQLAATPK
jgi:hypothetical protein